MAKLRPDLWESAETEPFIQRLLDEFKVPGIAVGIIDGDDISIKNFGSSRLPSTPVNDMSIFDTASLSKSFTSAAIALLVEDDEKHPNVQWKTPVSEVLPEDFVLQGKYLTENVTIEDILSHRSGIPGHDDSLLGIHSTTPDCARSVTRNLRNLAANRGLREEYQYSNIMFTAASHLVEVVTGESFADFLRQRLWKPLGMDHTFFDIPGVEAESQTKHLATGYRWDEKTRGYVELPCFRQPEGQGAGCIFSCAEDYGKWIRCMIRRSLPLSEHSHKELVKPRIIADLEGNPERRKRFFSHSLYALGWEIETYRGRTVIGHNGSVPGFGAMMKYLQDIDWGIVIFGNAKGEHEVADILCWYLIDAVLGVPKEERIDWVEVLRSRSRADNDGTNSEPGPTTTIEDHIPLTLPMDQFTGQYFNAGYHCLSLGMKDGNLWADCFDRCYPYILTFRHRSGESFVVELYDVLDAEVVRKMEACFRIEENKITVLEIAIVEDMPDKMVFFNKTA